MFEFKIERLERIKENGTTKRICIGVTCTNTDTGQNAYTDWEADVKDVGKTKSELKDYIKNYLKAVTNQGEIDQAVELQKTDAKAVVPEAVKRVDSLKNQTLVPVVTREAETILGEDNTLTV